MQISDTTKGIISFTLSALCFSIMGILIKQLSYQGVHVFTIVLYRSVIGLLLFSPLFIKHISAIRATKALKLHACRGISGFMGFIMFCYAITVLPFTEVTALSFTVPLFSTLAAMFFLKEHIGWHRWVALIVGFCGVLVILRPGFADISFAAMIVIGATVCWSMSNVFIKKLTKTESPIVIVFYMTTIMVPLSLIIAIPYYTHPTLDDMILLAGVGVLSVAAQFLLSHSYSQTNISILQPFDFFRLVFVSIISYYMYNDVLDSWHLLGAIIISVSSIYITRREFMLNRHAKK